MLHFQYFSAQMEMLLFPVNNSLTGIELPSGIINIKEGTFFSCAALKEIVIPEKVRNIGDNAFSGCYSLEKVTFPSVLKNI